MIYILTLVFVLLLGVHFDIGKSKKYENTFYYIILIWLIFISGFQYMMGSDISYYMEEYENLSLSDFSLNTLRELSTQRRQFGWLIFLYCCRIFSSNFFLPKLIQAFFINFAIFTFCRKVSKFPFFCIFFYLLIGFLVLNFNILRQSIALGFELFAILYLIDKKYWKFALFVFLAFQFHNSALILCFIPVIRLISYNKYQLITLFFTLVISLLIITSINVVEIIFNITQSGLMGDNLANVGLAYMQSERQGVREEFSIFSLKNLVNLSILIWYFYKNRDTNRKNDLMWGYFGLIAFCIDIFSGLIPIIWRFRIYFEFGYYLIYSWFVCTYFRNKFIYRLKPLVICTCILLISIFPLRTYFLKYPGSNFRYIDQYYPYHTIFNPVRDYSKEYFFKNL